MKYALVTGASSGIGYALAHRLSTTYGYGLIVVARREDRLQQLVAQCTTPVVTVCADLSTDEGILKVLDVFPNYPIEVVVNNAGFGLIGAFSETDEHKELQMIDVNVIALHRLFKAAVRQLQTASSGGYVMNVGSVAGYFDGPHMSTYFATKNYVRALTRAVASELRRTHSSIRVSLLAPGPVSTEFGATANQVGRMNGKAQAAVSLTAEHVARSALRQMFRGKLDIIPGGWMRVGTFMMRFVPPSWIRFFLIRYYH